MEPKNDSFINKLDSIIKNKRISYKLSEFGKLDYKILMNNPSIKIDDNLIKCYRKLNSTYHYKINMESKYDTNLSYISKEICDELSSFGYSDIDICDMLIKHLYKIKRSKCKESLWFCYGDIIYNNISKNIKGLDFICIKCGKRFKKEFSNQEYCLECGHKYQPKLKKSIVCMDCGKELKISAWDTKTYRCEECQKLADYEPNPITAVKCIDCGKTFNTTSLASKTYRCPKCQSLANYSPIITKTITCIDCGNPVEVDAKDNSTNRCDDCNEKHKKEIKSLQNKRAYEKRKLKIQ